MRAGGPQTGGTHEAAQPRHDVGRRRGAFGVEEVLDRYAGDQGHLYGADGRGARRCRRGFAAYEGELWDYAERNRRIRRDAAKSLFASLGQAPIDAMGGRPTTGRTPRHP
ncbi:hypothetical protein ABZW18_23430 [Streptomyces sp. NPDC004647]|uniref:hypothetical protein n=1 Tax=Streptomyces sp. NPDC004647 TaxID=3154671 RepID=UPI0033BAD645